MKQELTRSILNCKATSKATLIRFANVLMVVAMLFTKPAVTLADSGEAVAIYWTLSGAGTIQRANLNGSGVEDVVTGLSFPNGIAIDPIGGKVYWTDTNLGRIQRANLDGSDVQEILTGLLAPSGLALDIAVGKMYWVENPSSNVGDKIRRANLDGTELEDLIISGLIAPRGIALDTEGGKMYWTDTGLWTIKRANLDGTYVEPLIQGVAGITDVALDLAAGEMYWTAERALKIQRANLDGSAVEDIVTEVGNPVGLVLNLGLGKIYWTRNEGGDTISRANLDGTEIEEIITYSDFRVNPGFIAIQFNSLMEVVINIKPGSYPNSINACSGGTTPVAIFGSDMLDVTSINADSLILASASVKTVGKSDRFLCSIVDIGSANPSVFDSLGDPDGFADLVCHFITIELTELDDTSSNAGLTGNLNDGTEIGGEDSVNVVKDCG